MKTNKILLIAGLAMMISAIETQGQEDTKSFVNTLRLEARADFEYSGVEMTPTFQHAADNRCRFVGQYFNLHMGGNIGEHFSYYYRQRIIANAGHVTFFDNTDFLYIDYAMNRNWSFRFGKDALAYGGYEYDASPIDVYFNGRYWDAIYCFQLAASAAYRSDDGNHTLRFQFANSPYVHHGSPYGTYNMFTYNLLWTGKMGCFSTLYSIGMTERKKGYFVSNIMLGNRFTFDHWDFYIDMIHRGLTYDQLTKNWGVIGRVGIHPTDYLTLFVKGGYEQNMDKNEMVNYANTGEIWDCLSRPGQRYSFAGLGVEYRPTVCPDLRIHAFIADKFTQENSYDATNEAIATGRTFQEPTVNVGATWNMNVLKYIKKAIAKIEANKSR